MKITIIYDNTVYQRGLKSDWGFSSLVEIENTPRILFDSGTNGSILLSNMKKLNIEPASIDEVFISHPHFDHIGGLSDFLKVNPEVKVYVPLSCPKPSRAKETVSVKESLQIHENVFSTGELDGIEQSMAIKTDKGIVIIAGCSHPRMAHILGAASEFGKIYGIIGGLHGFHEFDLFKNLELICPCHCTQFKSEIKSLYPEKCIDGGAGKIIQI
ncbi:MAG: MBL fold metallo-hydrolase [Chloroflexota bacterium]|nr:MBL fold metallo-hydrolase [Chloroflexota bacterium]